MLPLIDFEADFGSSSQSDDAALEQEDRLQNLDRVFQTFIKAYVKDQTQLDNLISNDFGATKALISAAMKLH
jgi:hypothetical protein